MQFLQVAVFAAKFIIKTAGIELLMCVQVHFQEICSIMSNTGENRYLSMYRKSKLKNYKIAKKWDEPLEK